MAKRPAIRTYNETHLRKIDYSSDYPSEPDLPHWIVRAYIRGLLLDFSMPARRRKLEAIDILVLEEALLASIKSQAVDETIALQSGYTNDRVLRIANSVPTMMRSVLDHPSQSVLSEESKRLIPLFNGYTELTGREARASWLGGKLPDFLSMLLRWSQCPVLQAKCPRRTDVPGGKELKKWADKNGTMEAIFHILAHHHASTPAIVKDRLYRLTPRRSPGNKPPR